MKVVERIPTLGDLCDIKLAAAQDPFAIARLFQRWIEPAPTLDQLRALTMVEMSEYFNLIAAHITSQTEAIVASMQLSKERAS